MKARFRLTFIILALVVVICAIALFGCTPEQRKEGSAERIQVEDTHIYLAPQGDPSTYQLKPLVYPVDTASQKVYYRLADNTDREYLDVSAEGLIRAHKLKTDEEGNNLDIVVRIISAENNDVTLDVTVTIETVKVEKIIFNPSTISITLHGNGVDLKPEFKPAHAITGRAVIYTSLNPKVATVDSNGHVTPVSIGVCSIWVQTPKAGAFETQVESHVTINVTYSKLDYRLDLISDTATLRQVAGDPEPISFVLSQLDPFTDPNPSITWKINDTTINDVGVKDSKVLTYIPSTLPVGEYHIKAILTNSFETQEVVSDTLKIYSPLLGIRATLFDEPERGYAVGDSVKVQITHKQDEYPPESYRVTIETPTKGTKVVDVAPSTFKNTDGTQTAKGFTYAIAEAGNYTMQVEAIVKGRTTGVKSEVINFEVDADREGNDVTGVYFDGTIVKEIVDGQEVETVYSTVFWDALPYSSEYEVMISVEKDGAIVEEHITSDGLSAGYFGANYFMVPTEIATIKDSYSIKIKGERYGWTEVYTYNGDIPAGATKYFGEIVEGSGINRYVANLEEYGRLLNYVIAFRPTELLTGDKFRLDLYVPFTSEDLDPALYPVSDGSGCIEEEAGNIDAFKVFATAMATYVESSSLSIDILEGATMGANASIDVRILNAKEPDKKTDYVVGEDDEFIYVEVPSVNHYAEEPRGEGASLPIDSLESTMEVSTSNELFYAVSLGYRPIPVVESRAETIYNEAKSVLNAIISNDMTDTAKALAIYEWLSSNVVYDYKLASLAEDGALTGTNSYNSFYLEGVFIDHLAVCDGIAKAYTLMCAMEGIVSHKVVGEAMGTGVGHAWNVVLLEGKWYVVDATWASEKATVGKGSEAQNVELLTKAYFGIGKESKDTHLTFGLYPELDKDSLEYAYTIKINPEYDSVIESDKELTYYVKTHLYNYLEGEGIVWAEVMLEEEYLLDKGSYEAIILVINNAVPNGAEVELYRVGNRLFIKYERT